MVLICRHVLTNMSAVIRLIAVMFGSGRSTRTDPRMRTILGTMCDPHTVGC